MPIKEKLSCNDTINTKRVNVEKEKEIGKYRERIVVVLVIVHLICQEKIAS